MRSFFGVGGIRTRLLFAVLGAVAAAVAAMTVGFNLLLARSLLHNATDLARGRATAQDVLNTRPRAGLPLGSRR